MEQLWWAPAVQPGSTPPREHTALCLPSFSALDAFPWLHRQGSFTFIPCYRRKDEGGVIGGEDLAVSCRSVLIEQIFMDVEV